VIIISENDQKYKQILRVVLLITVLLILNGNMSMTTGVNMSDNFVVDIVVLNLTVMALVIFSFYALFRYIPCLFDEEKYSISKLTWLGIFTLGLGVSSIINGYGKGFLLGVTISFLIMTFSTEFTEYEYEV